MRTCVLRVWSGSRVADFAHDTEVANHVPGQSLCPLHGNPTFPSAVQYLRLTAVRLRNPLANHQNYASLPLPLLLVPTGA